jgi:hypothetical protein
MSERLADPVVFGIRRRARFIPRALSSSPTLILEAIRFDSSDQSAR